MTVIPGASGKFVQLNVGGTVFNTTLATLEGGSSMLSKMFSGQMEPGLRDEQGRVYIDRDPKHFSVILKCLRCGDAPDAAAKLLPAGRAEQRELLLEAQYYGCEGLVAALEAAEQQWAYRELCDEKRQEALANIDTNRASVLKYAYGKKAEAEEALQQARAELQARLQQSQQLAATARGAAPAQPAAQEEHVRAAYQLLDSATAADRRGSAAAKQRLDAETLRLAALGGGAEPAALALWAAEREAAKRELANLADARMPALDDGESDSDGEEDAALAAANVQRFRAALEAAEAAGGGAGALGQLNWLPQLAGLDDMLGDDVPELEDEDGQPVGQPAPRGAAGNEEEDGPPALAQGGSSMLSKMFSGQMEPGLRDEEGRVYIDRDPKHFSVILNCLRCGDAPDAAVRLVPAGRAEQRELLLEAQYYGCEGLVAALVAAEQDWEQREALEFTRLEAAASVEWKRTEVLREAYKREAVAAEAVQQSLATLRAAKQDLQQLVAAGPAARQEQADDAARLKAAGSAASSDGLRAVHQRFSAQRMQLALICGRADPLAAAMWQADVNTATEELTSLLRDVVHLHDAAAGVPQRAALGRQDQGLPALLRRELPRLNIPFLGDAPSDEEEG
ncbi:BTB POZ domain-containing adapter for CUL3-mediated degradation 3 isoform B [Chlorella sorokiniana]|uniref:BTB POZ domain-containing adapter for CUL3-mediated degradation 3 isoform B n=1 Tax=Chlorella sorokiniana TaxID=3076 RepID=A0A2P6TUP3_CHLSO|nr:BTB POZ domain-containing adapter for CUL3-mediated degradation 3 isoform B [Chlorella sorokiniana]|eukprot:PRW57790.1 BTB POZ domain-containing adapter for CUL3-mediated degradation 3 isoform B [Chlorella sorokiniana]